MPEVDEPAIPALGGPLASRNFRFLLAGRTAIMLGNAIAPVALAFAVLHLGGSAAELGVVVAARTVAELVTVLFGGVLGDRLPRGLMMQGSAVFSALTQGLIAWSLVGSWSSIALLTVISFLNGCVAALSGPSSSAMIGQTVPAANLSAAISAQRISANAAQIVGTAVAGVLVAAFGSGWAIAVDAVTFAIGAGCFAAIRVAPVAARVVRSRMLAELHEGLMEVLRRTWLWVLIAQALVYHLFYGGAQGVLGPIVVGDMFGEAAWGWALAAMMTGFVTGGLLTLRFRPRRGLFWGTVLLFLTAAFPVAMAITDNLWLLLLGAFLHGFGLEVFSVNWDLSIQQQVPADRLARVYSFDQVGSYIARPLGLVLIGPLAEAYGTTRVLLLVAAVMGGSVLLVVCTPAVRRLERL